MQSKLPRQRQGSDQEVRGADEVIRRYYEDGEPRESEAFRDITETVTATNQLAGSRHSRDERQTDLAGGDVDAGPEDYDVGTETPGGSNPTPDQDRVDDIGASVGITYEDNEPLKFGEKAAERDRNRWELNPASAEDYQERRSDETTTARPEQAGVKPKSAQASGAKRSKKRNPQR
jgi:hypothetical protein